MSRLRLFYRLMLRPLFREPVRLSLTILAIALGVAVVLAIELAGSAATGSFHSSLETLAGEYDFELVASGGVPENLVGLLASQPLALQLSPRIEDFALLPATHETLPLLGLDLVSEASRVSSLSAGATDARELLTRPGQPVAVWVGADLRKSPGDSLTLVVNDETAPAIVRGVFSDSAASGAIVMDIADAQRLLRRSGRVDRLLVKLPQGASLESFPAQLWPLLPPGVEIRPQGASTDENRKMLSAFRWNLRLLSYIALVVGAFLIYNTISVSVVRRRAEIGILRALGAAKSVVFAAFLGEAACLGLAGALLGIPLGRLLATGAVRLMSLTVQSLYVSSRPGAITLSVASVLLALLVGVGVAVLSALSPAREALQVAPVDAMALGRREFLVRVHKGRDLLLAAILAALALLASRAPAIAGKPFFGYLATLLLIAAAAFAIPAFVDFAARLSTRLVRALFGVEGLLATRSLAASLRRTSVLVGALSTAVAMMVSVGIMVGSFRQTVVLWMQHQLPADLYIRPAGSAGPDRHPTLSPALAADIAQLPGVAAVDRLRAYEITYDNLPVTLAGVDVGILRAYRQSDFLSGRSSAEVLEQLRGANAVVVSEPFTSKHRVRPGDTLTLPLGASRADFRILDVYYDYASERGYILMDRDVLLRYLPDPAPSNLAVFLSPGADPSAVRKAIFSAAAGRPILVFSDAEIRAEAVRIFDRTFAITYALEAIAVLVAVMGVAGALLALVMDRRRELGLLRFLGASSAQIRKLILVESALIGLLSNLSGFLLGYFLSLILVFVINKQSFGWTIHFHWPVAILLAALTVVYLATLLAGLYPARIAVRLNPLEVIHEE